MSKEITILGEKPTVLWEEAAARLLSLLESVERDNVLPLLTVGLGYTLDVGFKREYHAEIVGQFVADLHTHIREVRGQGAAEAKSTKDNVSEPRVVSLVDRKRIY